MVIDLSTDEILPPDLSLRPVPQAEKTDNINTWILDTQDTVPVPILSPSNDLVPQAETMANTDVSGFTQLTNCSQDTRTWLENTASSLPHLQGKLLSLEHYDSWMNRITTLSGAESVTAAVALRNLKSFSEDAMNTSLPQGAWS